MNSEEREEQPQSALDIGCNCVGKTREEPAFDKEDKAKISEVGG